ncbi:MAG: hypothetical protein ACK5V5_03890 [Cyclobacteriaceae bacterium]|jgi:hypothetical protein|nr:hypothetical protein [Flammeovirgaceae bacterium]
MTVVISKKDSRKTIVKKLKSLRHKGFAAHKFLGKVKAEGDGLTIQKRLRHGWKKRSG